MIEIRFATTTVTYMIHDKQLMKLKESISDIFMFHNDDNNGTNCKPIVILSRKCQNRHLISIFKKGRRNSVKVSETCYYDFIVKFK